MAAVAAEPGAASVPPTTKSDNEGPLDQDPASPGLRVTPLEAPVPGESGAAVELVVSRVEDGAEERRHVGPEPRPAAGKELADPGDLVQNLPGDRDGTDLFSPGLLGESEGGGNVSRSLRADPQPPAVFLHSLPAPPPQTEAGLSLDEPAEPTTNGTTNGTTNRETNRTEPGRERGYRVQPDFMQGTAEDGLLLVPDSPDQARESEQLPVCGPPDSTEPGPEPGPGPSVKDLSPGSEVRVCLDHVIDDALVVSFRLGEKVFSGVLMDVCKRFGPYGIPITTFPRRDDRSGPQLSVPSPPVAIDNHSVKQEEVTTPHHPWTSKPPPLFQEGAPYPPPLFIRDTYNQALPQPLPRKIKRLKRRYRCEEPTSIMNAIKLRPRQVLCDKCKGVVASGGHREARRSAVDLRGEEASRRRRPAEGPISSEVKRLKTDDRASRPAADRRPSSALRVTSSSTSARRVLRGVDSAASSRMCLNSKKVLDKRSAVDRSKTRAVLNKLVTPPRLTPPPRRPKDHNQNMNQTHNHDQDRIKAVTRAAALQDHNQKVHFTRRLQHLSSAPVSSGSPLPPRMRIKPQSTTLKSC
uniref:PWWP domain containing 2A n=1 Tax=Labrus bergylta TaxID=56723 RepID=A0A3Q3FVJ8_9LABR